MNEAQTEFEYIDPALREVGWGINKKNVGA